jgi:hypothetical protein
MIYHYLYSTHCFEINWCWSLQITVFSGGWDRQTITDPHNWWLLIFH